MIMESLPEHSETYCCAWLIQWLVRVGAPVIRAYWQKGKAMGIKRESCPKLVLIGIVWRNHQIKLGLGALIFVARQLWPKMALTGSSSSEASIKATLFQDQQTTVTEGEPRDYNTEHFIHLRVIAAERKFITTMFKVAKYYRVPSTQIIQVSRFSGSNI